MSDVKVWRYARQGTDWFVVFMDEIGCVSIQSDYGDYSYRWGAFGDDIRTFLMQCNEHYLTDKFTHGRDLKFHGQETIANLKREVISQRRNGDLDKDQAADIWFTLPTYATHEADFENEALDFLRANPDVSVYRKETQQIEAFFEQCWPDVIKQIKESIELDEYCK